MDSRQARYLRAILHILMSALGFALMSAFVKLSGELPSMQKAFFRNAVATVLALGILLRHPAEIRLPKGSALPLFLRCFCGTVGLIANFWALDHMRIADANMLNKLSPFFAVLMSVPVLKERPTRTDLLCVLVALCGAAFIVKPGAGVASLPALVALLGGLGAGMAYTFVRRLGQLQMAGPLIVLSFSVFSTLATLPSFILNYQPMSGAQLASLLMAGSMAAFAQLNITAAYSLAPARDISVFDYTQVIFATLLGFWLFGEVPDALAACGYVLIIGAALGKWCWSRRRTARRS